MLSRGKLLSGLVIVVGAMSLLVVSCAGPKEVRVGGGDKGKVITLPRGQTLVVTLDSNPTTGYSWVVLDLPAAVLAQAGEVVYKQSATGSGPVVGAGGTETFRFTARAAGKATLNMGYLRLWEKDVPPIETYSLEVEVR